MSAIFLVSAWCLLCSVGAGVREEVYAAGRVGNAGDDVALHNMVHEALVNKKGSSENPAELFAADHASLHGLALTAEEAATVAKKLTDADESRRALVRVLEAAAELKGKMSGCAATRGRRRVEELVERGPGEAAARRLEQMVQNWRCPEEGEVSKAKEDDQVVARYLEYLSQVRKQLQEDPGPALQTVLSYLVSKGWVPRDLTPVAQMLAQHLQAAPEYLEYFFSAFDYVEKFAETESGRRVVRLIPRLTHADADEALDIFKHEADFNQEVFFSLMANGDLAESFLKKVARRIIGAVQYCGHLLEDDLKFAILNSLFISNNIPPLNRKNLLKSSMDAFEKLTHRYTPFIETTNYYESVRDIKEEIERRYFRFEDLSRLSDEEMENALGKFLEDNLVDPARDAWLAHRQVTSASAPASSWCAPQLMCLYSRNYHRRGQGKIVRWIADGLASLLAYFWTSAHGEEDGVVPEELAAAAEHGRKAEEREEGAGERAGAGPGAGAAVVCDRFRPKKRGEVEDCDVFTLYREKKVMNIRYLHNEL